MLRGEGEILNFLKFSNARNITVDINYILSRDILDVIHKKIKSYIKNQR